MPANAVRSFEASNDGTALTVTATTWLPANPTLLTFCCPYRLIPKTRLRGGEEVPHGNLLYMDCVPKRFEPTGGDGITSFVWSVPNTDYLPCHDCNLAIVEFGLAHPLDWTTQVHPCPALPQASVHFNGATTFECPDFGGDDITPLTYSYWFKIVDPASALGLPSMWGVYTSDIGVSTIEDPIDAFYTGGPALGYGVQFSSWATDPNDPTYTAAWWSYTDPVLAAGVWHHVAVSANTLAKTLQVFIDGNDYSAIAGNTRNIGPGFLQPANGFDFWIGSYPFPNPSGIMVADIYDFWFAPGIELDLADPAVLALFIDTDLAPVDLGPLGDRPLGVPPAIFGHGDPSAWLQPNLGTGGDFAITGALGPGTIVTTAGAP